MSDSKKDVSRSASKAISKSKNKDETGLQVDDVYKSKTLHEHILTAPDTYIGTTVVDEVAMYIYNEDTQKIEQEIINYVAGFYKIFDEILVNARDHTVRDKTCKNIKITIDKHTGRISVWNDGNGIPIAIHKKHNIYVPEMIFGNLLTSQNYGKKGKTVGGKNGYGAKLANIYSKEFEIHTIGVDKIKEVDGKIIPDESAKKVEYKQIFKRNMYDVGEPEINRKISQTSKTFTKISYLPDYELFGMNGLSSDMYSFLIKRCYDIAACTPKTITITINDEEIKCRDFKDYIKLYYSDKNSDKNNDNEKEKETKPKITYEKVNSRWEVGVGFSKSVGDRFISFVNGISTFQGGTHVQHVVGIIVNKVTAFIKKKKDYKDLKIMPATIRQYLTFFVNCVIEDPGFNSQTKEYMNSKIADWCTCGNDCKDVKCDISDDFIEKLCNSGLMKEVVDMSTFKETKDLVKTDGKKVGLLKNVEKLDDADWAGKRNSHKTSIFLTEGDSAKAFAVSGISVIGNERYGVFPLRGKLLNVRNANAKQIKKNKEFINIKLILGLKQGIKYKDVSKLRYGCVIILTDQDPDGSHIKGLIINMLEYFWPELLQIKGFIKAYNTPIVKSWKKADKTKKNIKMFYTMSDFEKWKKENEDKIHLWDYKYYKGLGTSTDKEAKESFYNFDDNLVTFIWENDTFDELVDNNEISKMRSDLAKKGDGENKPAKKSSEDSDSSTDDDDSSEESEDSEDKEDKDSKDDDTDEKDKEEDDEKAYAYMNSKSHAAITKAFDGFKVNLRKEWLTKMDRTDVIEYRPGVNISYSDFINKDLIFFSSMDNDRSIPSMIDGHKPSQRMIMFCCFKRGRKSKEVKVAQLSGYVSENTDYHHGEASLQGAIIGIAQNYPGSNNISLLKPNGNFGYRRLGGKDAASPRYIFTELDPITNLIYREEDDEILKYNYLGTQKVEPDVYAPILPMILINGGEGIGTGWSTKIPPHNPKDIVTNLKRLINDKETVQMIPWFNGFKGTIEPNPKKDNTYFVKGKYTVDGSKVHIEDIPIVNGWIQPYEASMTDKISVSKDDNLKIESIQKNLGNNFINMVITFKGQELQKMYKSGTLDKYLHMTKNMSVSNLVLFNADGKLTKYDTISDIIQDFYEYRLKMYEKRRAYYLLKLQNDLNIAKYKVKFIKDIRGKIILLQDKSTPEVIKQLEDKLYPKLTYDHRDPESSKSYQYLTSMGIMNLTVDKIKELEKDMEICQAKYDEYLNTSAKDIWIKELDEFLVAYDKWCKEWEDEIVSADKEDPDKEKKGRRKSIKDKEDREPKDKSKESTKAKAKESTKAKSKESKVSKESKKITTRSKSN
jgi:DNA topoisomerase-2